MMSSGGTLDLADSPSIDEDRPSGVFVLVAIASTVLLFAMMFCLLLYRARTQRAPTKGLIVQADERWRGVTLEISGPALSTPLMATLDASNKYFVSFFLDPGSYTLEILDGDHPLLRQSMVLSPESETMGLDLKHAKIPPPATRPELP
jgi:hypothetical protein